MDFTNDTQSLISSVRISKLLQEANSELSKIEPEIQYLEECQKKLGELKSQKIKLNSLILSLSTLVNEEGVIKKTTTQSDNKNNAKNKTLLQSNVTKEDVSVNDSNHVFVPMEALNLVKDYLRTNNNLNYEIFKAIVYNSGIATTEQIKSYLVENGIKQPKSGKGFERVELKEISSRTNYLVRKNLLISIKPGIFKSTLGWNNL